MSQKTVQLVIGRLLTDEDLRARFRRAAARNIGRAARTGLRADGRRDRRARAQRREDVAVNGQGDSSAAAALQQSSLDADRGVHDLRGRLIGIEIVLPQAHVQLRARQTEALGRLRLVPAALAHDLFDRLALDRVQVGGRRLGRPARRRTTTGAPRVISPPFAQNRGALERVAQLAHVARPVVPQQRLFRIARQARRADARTTSPISCEEGLAERQRCRPCARAAAAGGCRTPAADRRDPRGTRRAPPPSADRGWSRR